MWLHRPKRRSLIPIAYSRRHERREPMASPELKTITELLRARQEQAPADISFPESRALFEQMTAAFPLLEKVKSPPFDAAGIPPEWIAAQRVGEEKTINCLHGGGYSTGSLNRHRGLLGRISAAS